MSLPKIAVTMGDPAGVGPEVCLHLLKNAAVAELCVPVVFGDAVVLEQAAAQCGLAKPERYVGGLAEAEGPCAWLRGCVPCLAPPRRVDRRAFKALK